MKKIFLIIALFLFSAAAIAQPPKLFKYQGLARGSDGNPVSNTTIALRISIHQGTPTGTVLYKETHLPITNEFGSFSINIGAGTVVTGNFSTIPWSRYNYFQEVEMDVTGGTSFVSMGTSQYLSVPYALSADSARFGTAPFWVKNYATGNDSASVAIFAFANSGGVPAILCKNFGSGNSVSIHAESGNGIYIEGNSSGFETNGNLNIINGNIKVNGVAGTPGQVLSVNSSANLAWLPGLGFSNFQVFNSSGTFTVPAGITKLMVEVWGAGGAGSGTPAGNVGGAGGGGGGYGKSIFSVLPAALYAVTVGAGGTGVISGSGNAGGTSSFDVFISASGGAGGQFGGNGGFGGGSSGAFSVNGGNGGPGGNNSPNGFGGSAGGGGGAGHPGGGGQGNTPGGGGSGSGVPGTAGGNGANGRVVVWW